MSCVIRRLFSAKLLHSSVSSPQLQQQQQRLQLLDLLAFKQPHTDPRPPSDTAYNYVANKSVVHKVKANRPNENNRIQALPDQLQCFNKHGNDRVPRKAPRDQKHKPGYYVTTGPLWSIVSRPSRKHKWTHPFSSMSPPLGRLCVVSSRVPPSSRPSAIADESRCASSRKAQEDPQQEPSQENLQNRVGRG
jgi:hypothetical protein